MKKLEERILHDGNVLGENILKVDSFLTHQVDFSLMKEIGRVFADRFRESGITKVVTIEASGIAPAVYTAEALGVPMIFAKKAKNITMTEGILTAEVYSFTKQVTSTVSIAGKFLSPSDKVLVIDANSRKTLASSRSWLAALIGYVFGIDFGSNHDCWSFRIFC